MFGTLHHQPPPPQIFVGVAATMAFFLVFTSVFALRIRTVILQSFELMAPERQTQMVLSFFRFFSAEF